MDCLIALVRTGDASEKRHAGLTQMVVDMRAEGITVRPILDLSGHWQGEIGRWACAGGGDALWPAFTAL